jgi:hypothetical protein
MVDLDLVWTSLAWPGLEHVNWTEGETIKTVGHAVHVLPEGPFRLDYAVATDASARTRSLELSLAGATETRTLSLNSDTTGRWWNGEGDAAPDLDGCIDVDISVTPLTNTLPIRRLGLGDGESADLLAVYVDVPKLYVSAQRQRYTRLASMDRLSTYRYESGSFRADITVDQYGLVLDYPDLWHRRS